MGRSPWVAIAFASALAGCASVLGFDVLLPGSEPTDGGPTDPGGDGEPANARWYVSPAGDDANDGSRAHPLRSLAQAVRLANTAMSNAEDADAGGGLRVALCTGDYPEGVLSIAGPVEVRGNYDCTSWRRPFTNDDVRGATFVSGSKLTFATQSGPVKAFVETKDRSGAPLMDGLHISAVGVGAVVAAHDATRLHELKVEYGLDTGERVAGIAAVTLEGSPSLEHCLVEIHDVGDTTPVGVTAVAVGSANATLRRNKIDISSVQGACIGVSANRSVVRMLENAIEINSCALADEDDSAAVGVASDATTLSSTRDTFVFASIGHVAGKVARNFAIGTAHASGPAAPVDVDGDVIVAPSGVHPKHPASALTFSAIEDVGCVRRIVNTSVVLDATSYALENAFGFAFYEPTKALIAHNSFYLSGLGTDAGRPAYAIGLIADALDQGKSSATVHSNVAVSNDPRIVFFISKCTSPGVVAALHNRYAGLLPGYGSECGVNEGLASPTVDASDNGELSCEDGGCGGLFRRGPDDDVRGLRLVPDVACQVNLGVPFAEDVPDDGTGADRNKNGTTAGAFERECP